MGDDLLQFVSSFEGGDGLRVEETLGGGYVRLRVSEAERRQAKHDIRCVEDAVIELLRNARDAGAHHIFVATSREGDVRTICVIDDGSGIPQSMHQRVFDARVTSKLDSMLMDRWGVHGRGMALYSIAQNALEARVMSSGVGMGTSLRCTFDVSTIQERADQSTWPTVTNANGDFAVRGPRNILRASVEFALEAKDVCNVYVGSPSEIIATLRTHGNCGMDAARIVDGPSMAKDARELRHVSEALGIEMSQRTAHRIMKNQIAPLVNVRSKLIGTRRAKAIDSSTVMERTLSLSQEDKELFAHLMEQDFAAIAKKYYVIPTGRPRITAGKGRITVTFEYLDDD
ncbi:MAG: ATP-binding protein [Coriobacteriales bacterium]|nr:ATP-binding protein [Coriobacteriales bacterium]